jgi:hypothetical protein
VISTFSALDAIIRPEIVMHLHTKSMLSLLTAAIGGLPVTGHAATFAVTTTADSGTGSLRQALLDANAAAGLDNIHFAIPGAGPHQILPASDLPGIRSPVVIDGYTQPGASVNTAVVGSNAQIRIVIIGPGDFSIQSLALLAGSTGSTIRGLAINGFGGSQIFTGGTTAGSDCVITGNFIGTDATGEVVYPSAPGTRTGISVGAQGCRIGGPARADRNLVSGNSGSGIYVSGAGAIVQGNLVGTDKDGARAMGNSCGISVDGGAIGVTIGGVNDGVLTPRNVVSGNTRCGIELRSGSAHVIEGNLIGLTAFPIATIPNLGPGVLVGAARNVRIGFGIPGEVSNGIFGNAGPGVLITGPASGDPPQGIAVFGNAIHGNDGLAIDLAIGTAEGVTPNDPLDVDTGPNALQNFPELTGVTTTPTQTIVHGRLSAEANRSYFIDVYTAPSCHGSGYSGGSSYLNYVVATTDASGNAMFDVAVDGTLPDGFASATATPTTGDASTSEMSRCLRLGDVIFEDGFEP